MTIEIVPATIARWRDVREVFGTRGDASSCFCQFLVDPEWSEGRDHNQRALHEQIAEQNPAAGLIAYREGTPVGWVQLGPRSRYVRLTNQQAPEVAGWFITCFVVPVQHRRKGVSRALLAGAVSFAHEHGARVVRALPTDTSSGKRPGSDLYRGVLSAFLAAGFHEVQRNRSRVLVQLELGHHGVN